MKQQIKHPTLLKALAKRLKYIRNIRNIRQEDVDMDTGINISRIEMGIQNLTLSTLYTLCEYYSVSLADFFSEGFVPEDLVFPAEDPKPDSLSRNDPE
ncbi:MULTISPECIES: helix-turn-helix transcriptional regulator [Flavobacterium]|uniref:helix-turn-helix domain-containing protein n=1 Tax=Flavobacterium TaxID=237 RepID=UPI0009620EE8|nr:MULTISPECIES: helix-turn-helix transcriptional regulator [Flavobacterium]MBN9283884.1 helix-turn-helix transcriptional regulator [Flavobacterium sp.]OJV68618.1 MAG: hypothetical protein BGO42_01945 [Flavobacterium sp. 40-81]